MTREDPTTEEDDVSEATEAPDSKGVHEEEAPPHTNEDDGAVDLPEPTGEVEVSGGDSGNGLPFPEGKAEEDGADPVHEELARLRDQHLRLAADFENYRKRAAADLAGVWARARADLVRSLVQGLDDLQRVSQFTSEDTTVDALIEGVDLVERNLLKALTEAGLEVLNPVGERFDPNTMEAMMRVSTEEDGQDETVHQVFQKGYMFKEQLVRPARVSVFMDDD